MTKKRASADYVRAPSRQILVNAELLLSALVNSLAPSWPILFPCNPAKIKSQTSITTCKQSPHSPPKLMSTIVVFFVSSSANSLAPSSPILFPCNPAKIKSPDVNHNVQTKSALTTQVDVDKCGVFLEQLGKLFGATVTSTVPYKQKT